MIYVLNKENFKFIGRFDNMKFAKEMLNKEGILEDDCIFAEETGMKYVSRIVEVDGKVIYNNKDWWTKEAPYIIEDYENHSVYDFLEVNKPEGERTKVSLDRFKRELCQNVNRINEIDGRAGEVCYNIEIGNEVIALFREECILTDFQGITPMQIGAKLAQAYTLLMTGSFREAKQIFMSVETDPFLTVERKQKYIDMLNSADAIRYANAEDYIFTTEEEKRIEETYKRVTTAWSQSDWNSYRYALASIGADDKYIMVIRHADRDSNDTGITGDINETGLNSCKTVAEQMKDGTTWTKDGVTYLIDCPANNAHYFSTNYTRTKHTAQALAEYRLDTDSAASDFSGITDATETLVAERFLKEPKVSGNSDLLSRWINDPSSLTQEELTVNIGVSTAEEAAEKLTALANQFTQEILALADKRLNVFVTHDYYLVPLVAAMTDVKCSKTVSNKWLNYEAGLGIILHSDNTFEAFPIRCKSNGYM